MKTLLNSLSAITAFCILSACIAKDATASDKSAAESSRLPHGAVEDAGFQAFRNGIESWEAKSPKTRNTPSSAIGGH